MKFASAHGIEFEHQFILDTPKGAFTFDFRLANDRLVETDGEYWHRKSLEQFTRDRIKEGLAREAGYILVRISDKDWRPEIALASEYEILVHNDAIMAARMEAVAKAGSRKASKRKIT